MIEVDVLPSLNRLRIPARYQLNMTIDGLKVKRLFVPEIEASVKLEAFRSRGNTSRRVLAQTDGGERFILEFGSFNTDYGDEITGVIRSRAPVVTGNRLFLSEPRFRQIVLPPYEAGDVYRSVHKSWNAGIQYVSERIDTNGQILQSGFRQPQIGALHAIASHWTLSHDPAVIVMPTGTGKTEVMIATAIASSSSRMLVVVPTDALRQQTADKFEAYGVLESIGVTRKLPYPVVGLLSSKPTHEHFGDLEACNIVISTMSSIALADEDVQRGFAGLFSNICFDEAHHIPATTWKRFQEHSKNAKILLLTATPFREDGKAIQGKIIYNYPLSAAQDNGYFRPIQFLEVFEPDELIADQAIAEVAVQRLREDIAQGHDHLLMARTKTIDAAKALYHGIYERSYSDLRPVVIHSQTRRRGAVLKAIRDGQHKIIICVDMFGEGFDLPNLKIAALHSVHKSLGVTLQFIGRFARTALNVGPATFVANTAEDGVPEALESLYQEDADWNALLADLSYDAIDPQAKLSELVGNLEDVLPGDKEIEISTLALRPKISTTVYRTSEFYPNRYNEAFRSNQHILQPQISRIDNFLVLIVNQREKIDWTDSRDIAVDNWDLYIAYFDPDLELLYIHSSRKGDSASHLAKKISHDPLPIREEEIFKALSGLRRLTLHSVGLSSRSRNVRYQMFAGLDVGNAITPLRQQTSRKSNIMGVGYEEGERRSIGCSRKGKIWAMRSGSLAAWRSWCNMIGAKLSDPNSQSNEFLRYTLIPATISQLPECQALMADWPDQLFESFHFRFEVVSSENSYEFDDCQIDLIDWNSQSNSFQFQLRAGEDLEIVLILRLVGTADSEGTYEVELLSGPDSEIVSAGKRLTVVEFFNENPPLVRLEDGSQLAGNILLRPQEEMRDTFDRDLIQTLDWTGIDIRKESRWKDGTVRLDSIQQHFIDHLENGPYTFIIDDDDTGESADIVAIQEADENIVVYLWHCKYSSGDLPGNRIADLYTVCGQAQKGVKWTWDLGRLIKHLMNRETKHLRGRDTRFSRGTLHDLARLRKSAKRKFVNYRVGVVQPGLSKANMPADHLSMLGSTNSFIQCITDYPLLVVASA